jgi:hypothetical protein
MNERCLAKKYKRVEPGGDEKVTFPLIDFHCLAKMFVFAKKFLG